MRPRTSTNAAGSVTAAVSAAATNAREVTVMLGARNAIDSMPPNARASAGTTEDPQGGVSTRPSPHAVGRGSGLEHRTREVVGVEGLEVVGLLADADELHRQADALADADDRAALRRAVELRDEQARHGHGRLELLGLLDRV